MADRTERDVAEFHITRLLGIIGLDVSFETDAKHLFWADNAVGDSLEVIMSSLTELGALEVDDERIQVRWNPKFDWKAPSIRRFRPS